MSWQERLESFKHGVEKRNPGEPEFHQAVYEVAASVFPYIEDKPWYHVLVHNSNQLTYVAERHLEQDHSNEVVNHPAIDMYFDNFENGVYSSNTRKQ